MTAQIFAPLHYMDPCPGDVWEGCLRGAGLGRGVISKYPCLALSHQQCLIKPRWGNDLQQFRVECLSPPGPSPPCTQRQQNQLHLAANLVERGRSGSSDLTSSGFNIWFSLGAKRELYIFSTETGRLACQSLSLL